MLNKGSKAIGPLRKLQNYLLRKALIAICEAFFICHQDYGNVLREQTFNNYFHEKLGSVTVGSQKFYKIFKNESSKYIFSFIVLICKAHHILREIRIIYFFSIHMVGYSFTAKFRTWHLYGWNIIYICSVVEFYMFDKQFLYSENDSYIKQKMFIFSDLKFIFSNIRLINNRYRFGFNEMKFIQLKPFTFINTKFGCNKTYIQNHLPQRSIWSVICRSVVWVFSCSFNTVFAHCKDIMFKGKVLCLSCLMNLCQGSGWGLGAWPHACWRPKVSLYEYD